MMKDDIEIVGCGESEDVGRKLVLLIFKREQLLYDIKNYCYIEGDIMPEDTQHSRHMVQDVGEEGNVDRVTRVLDLAHADIVERLYPFTQHELSHPVLDDRLRERPVYGVFLNVPAAFSQTTVRLLAKLIHELLVCTAVADWMSITNPSKEETWRLKVGNIIARINQVKDFRNKRTRIRPHWI